MSLPATHAEISANPSKMAVTAPVDSANKDRDVQRKLKLLGVVQGFRDGRMPDNKQIQEALEYAGTHSPVELAKLSPEGRVLIDDTRDILETLAAIVHEKNADELFQNAVWHTSGGDITRGKQDKDNLLPVSKSDADAEAKQAIAHLRTLVTLFVTNSEARKLFNDVGIIGRDLFATGAAKAAEKARPDQEQLDQVDKPAPSGEWVGPDGRKVGKDETPELQLKGPKGSEIRYNPKDDPRDAQVTDHEGTQRSAGHVYDKAQDAKEEAHARKEEGKQQAKEQAKDHASDVASSRDPNASLSEQKDQMLNRANEKAPDGSQQEQTKQSLKDKVFGLKDRIPDEHKDRANQQVERTKDFLNDNIPEERRDQFIYRLKKVVVECQEHSDYNEAMSWFLDTFENYKGHAKQVTGAGADSAKSVADDPAYKQATLEVRTLFERFANGQSMQPIINALDDLYSDAQNDEGLRHWFTKFNQYLHAILLEPGYILEDASTKEGQELRDSGREYFEGKYKPHFQRFFDEVAQWFTAMAEDPLNVRLGDDIKRLTKDLLFDENGSLTFKPALWEDLRRYILPSLIEQIGYVPIPRSEYSDDQIDLVVENLVLSGPNLFPNVVNIDAHNHFSFSPYENINKKLNTHHHTIHIGVSQIQADLRDVAFSFRRKKGWPKISDHGLADVVIGGKGISADITLESVENSRSYVFKVKESKVTVDTLKFSIRDSRHDLLYKFVKATANNVIKKAIQTAVGVAIKNALEELNSQLVEVKNRMEDAKKTDDTNRVEALKQVFQKKKAEAEQKKAEVEPKGTFRIVTDRDSQLNPDLTHNAKTSYTQKQFKVEDAAQSGKDWRSPVFSLVDPKHPAVTGEHHPATSTAQKAAAGAADAVHTTGTRA